MKPHTERRTAQAQEGAARPPTLVDLLYEGFYALFLLRDGGALEDHARFGDRMAELLAEVDQRARQAGIDPDDTLDAKYAFCAAVDETVLRSQPSIRSAWEARPLQLRMFGNQLAGEQFFDRLEELRIKGRPRLQSLEVYHMCLLLGFRGRYAINGEEKLSYVCARLGEEIARMRGGARPFAPHAGRPDQVANLLRRDLSLWLLCGVFGLAGMAAYGGLRASLSHTADEAMAPYNDLVHLPPQAASVTITLP